MKFLLFLEKLKTKYENDLKTTENGVVLLNPKASPPPLAEHYIFPPMPENVIQGLTELYKQEFPKELLELYRIANGMNLFWKDCMLPSGRKFPFCCLSIYGYPFGERWAQLQPYNISLEDLSRVPKTPKSYLKFGLYRKIENLCCKAEYDLFVDTERNVVCSSKRSAKEFLAEEHWASIDDCLCSLFNRM